MSHSPLLLVRYSSYVSVYIYIYIILHPNMTGLVPSYTIIPLYPISPLISLVVGILLNQRQSYVSNMVDQSCMVSPLYPFTAPTYASYMECFPTKLGHFGGFWWQIFQLPMVFLWFSCGFPVVFLWFSCLPCRTCRLSSEESPTEFSTLGHAGIRSTDLICGDMGVS